MRNQQENRKLSKIFEVNLGSKTIALDPQLTLVIAQWRHEGALRRGLAESHARCRPTVNFNCEYLLNGLLDELGPSPFDSTPQTLQTVKFCKNRELPFEEVIKTLQYSLVRKAPGYTTASAAGMLGCFVGSVAFWRDMAWPPVVDSRVSGVLWPAGCSWPAAAAGTFVVRG